MNVLTRYIVMEVIKGVAVALSVLLALLTFFSFTDELGDLGWGDYGLKQIFEFLILSLPREFYDLMPSAALLGGIVVLGNLANHRELMALQANGVSRPRIVGMVLLAGAILVVISVSVGEYVAPLSERSAHLLKATATKEEVASETRYGFWVRDGNVFINIRRVKTQDELGDISIYELSEGGQTLLTAARAAVAKYRDGSWQLEDIRTSRFSRDAVSSTTEASKDWVSRLAPDLLNVFVFRPENQSSFELARYVEYLKENGQVTLAAEKALWDRIVNPFVTLTMLLVALPMVFTINRETTAGQRIVAGITIGLGFYLLNRIFGHFGLIYDFNPIFAAALPTTLVLTWTVVGLVRIR